MNRLAEKLYEVSDNVWCMVGHKKRCKLHSMQFEPTPQHP